MSAAERTDQSISLYSILDAALSSTTIPIQQETAAKTDGAARPVIPVVMTYQQAWLAKHKWHVGLIGVGVPLIFVGYWFFGGALGLW